MIRRPIINTRQMSSAANKFKMDRRTNRLWGIGSSDALRFGYSSDQGSALEHRMIRRLDHRFIRRLHLNSTETRKDFCFSTGWTDAWIEDTIGSSDALMQIIQYHPKCGAFSIGWSDGASVYSVSVLSGFQGSMAILAFISDRMIRRSAGGHHRFIRRYNFFRGLFPMASLLC
jgi:hypothetical protein